VNARDWPGSSPDPGGADICRRCAGVGPTCCAQPPGTEETCFPISEMERRRIEEHLGLDRGAFTLEPNSSAFRTRLSRFFPGESRLVERLFPAAGAHVRLRLDREGRCVFLRRAGCLLPRQARPYYCRLFPFWVTADRVTVFSAAGCLARREGQDLAGMLALLNCAAVTARDLHGRLRLAWGLPPKEGMPFVTPSPARFFT
jgi:Fe-S-cluster containining protein